MGWNLSVIKSNVKGPVLVADQIEKPGNLGTMIRTAKSLGIENIICCDEITDFYNPNVIRASIGHLFTMNLISDTSSKIFDLLAKNKYQLILLDPEADALINNFKPKENFALVIGSEQYGISDNWKETAHQSLKIESKNDVDSINASTAAAIAMWELTK